MLQLQKLDRFDFAARRSITNIAAALSIPHIRRVMGIFPRQHIYSMYSMYSLAELKRVAPLPPEPLAKRPGSVGIFMRDCEVVVLDGTDTEGGPDQITELVVHGANILQGYWNAPEETAKRLRGAATELTPFSISLTCSAGTKKESWILSRGRAT